MYRLSLQYSILYTTIMSLIMVVLLYPTFGEASLGSGFSVEPAVIHVSVAEDTLFSSAFTLKNLEAQPVSVSIRVADFEPLDSGVGVREFDHRVGPDDPLFASSWVAYPKETLTLAPKKKLSVPFSIRVPKDAVPGGKSITFVVETIGGNVHSRMYVLCFLNIPGDARELLTIEDLSFGSPVYNAPHGRVSIQLKNDGDTHIRPEGVVVIRNMFGVERGRYMLSHTDAVGTLVPGARRTIEYLWVGDSGLFDFGLWNARLTLTYGNGNTHEVSARAFMLLFPVLPMALFVLTMGSSLFIVMRSVHTLKRELRQYTHIPFSEHEHSIIERQASMRLLVVPLLAGITLILIIGFTLISFLGNQDAGKLERVQKIYTRE